MTDGLRINRVFAMDGIILRLQDALEQCFAMDGIIQRMRDALKQSYPVSSLISIDDAGLLLYQGCFSIKGL